MTQQLPAFVLREETGPGEGKSAQGLTSGLLRCLPAGRVGRCVRSTQAWRDESSLLGRRCLFTPQSLAPTTRARAAFAALVGLMQGSSAAVPRTKSSPLNHPVTFPPLQEGSDCSPLPLGHLGQGTERQTALCVYICHLSTEQSEARESLVQASLDCIIRPYLKSCKNKTTKK